MARSTRKTANPTTSANAQAKARISPLDKVRLTIAKVSKDKGPGNVPVTDEDRRAAVIEATKLRELPLDVSAFVIKWAHLVHGAVKLADATLAKRDVELKEAEATFKSRKDKLAEARDLQRKRTADEVRFAYQVVKVHKIMTNDQLAASWGISKTGISKMTAAAANASTLGALGNDANVSYLLTVGAKDSKSLKAAMSRPGATMATVREATTTTQSKTTRIEQEEKRGNAESLDIQAHRELARTLNVLRVLITNGGTVADIGEVTAESLFKDMASLAKQHAVLVNQSKRVAARSEASTVPTQSAAAALNDKLKVAS